MTDFPHEPKRISRLEAWAFALEHNGAGRAAEK